MLVGCCVVVAKRNFESHFGLLRAVVILSSNLVVVPTAAILLLLVQVSLNNDYCLYRINGTILYESLSIFVHLRKRMNKVSVNVECEDSVRDLLHLNSAPYTSNVEDTIPEVGVDQWFSNLSEVSNPTGVMQAYIEPLIITRSGSRKF